VSSEFGSLVFVDRVRDVGRGTFDEDFACPGGSGGRGRAIDEDLEEGSEMTSYEDRFAEADENRVESK
jgi:hypothetical protein